MGIPLDELGFSVATHHNSFCHSEGLSGLANKTDTKNNTKKDTKSILVKHLLFKHEGKYADMISFNLDFL